MKRFRALFAATLLALATLLLQITPTTFPAPGFISDAHALGYATTLRNARLDAITTAVGSAGKLTIYSGTQPATCGTATTQLAQFTLGSPLASGASGGVLTVTAPSNVIAGATGSASWFRITTSGGTCVVDGTVGTSGADLNLATTSISIGATVSITSLTITHANQ